MVNLRFKTKSRTMRGILAVLAVALAIPLVLLTVSGMVIKLLLETLLHFCWYAYKIMVVNLAPDEKE